MPSSLIAAAVTYVTAAWAAVSFTAVATFAAKVALTIGISKLLANRTGTTAQGTQDAGGRVQLPPATDNKLPVVYGRAYISPIITDAIISSDQTTMWYVCSLCEVTGIGAINFEEVWIDGKRATLGTVDATRVLSLTTNSNPPQVDTKIDGNMNLYFYNNGSNQPANTGLTAIQVLQDSAIPANKRWTNTDTMSNTAFFIAKIKYNRDAGTTGLPTFTIKVRNDTKSPGEVLVDYLSNTRYGCGIPFSRIDEPSFGQLDVYSSQQITYYPPGGGVATQNRYVINGPLNTGVNCLTNLQQLCDACDSWLQYSELTGKWKVVINKAYTDGPNPQTTNSLFSVDSSNLIGGIEINPIDLNSTYNVMEIQYPNTNILDQTDYQIISLRDSGKPWYKPQLLSPNEPVNKLTIQLPQVNNYVQAIYLGVRRLLQTREDLIINFSTDYSGIQVEAGDVIKVSHEQYGWVDKLFRVSQVSEQKTLDGFLGARITAFEYNSTVYADDAFTNFIPEANTGLTDPNIFGVVNPPTVTYVGGGTIPQMTVVGVAPTTGSAIAIDFNYGTSSNSATHTVYTTVTSGAGTPFAPGENVTINVTDLAAGNYYWSITARNIDAGRRSTSSVNVVAWPGPSVTTWDPFTGLGGITSNNLSNLSVVAGKLANGAVIPGTIANGAVIPGTIANGAVTPGTIAANSVIEGTIANGAVTAGTIANGAIIAGSLGPNSVTSTNLAANSVIADKIAGGAITSTKLAGNAVISDVIAANAVIASKLAANSVTAGKIDALAVTAGTIAADAVTAGTIAAGVVTAAAIAAGAIVADKLAANSVTANAIASGSVTAGKIAANAVTAGTIAAGAITSDSLGANSITANNLQANSVIAGKIAAGAVSADNLTANSVTAGTIAAGAVTAGTIAANAITSGTIAANAVTAGTIAAGAITSDSLGANSITANNLQANSVTAIAIAANSVTAIAIAANSVTTVALAAGSVTANQLAANSVTAVAIAANSITTDKLTVDSITTDKITANAITTNKLAANSVTANQIAANAVTAGTIAAGAVTAGTIAANAITSNTIAANSITSDKIAANAITTVQLAANTVRTEQLIIGSVTQAKSSISSPVIEPVPFTNLPNAWPTNTRSIIPTGGVTIIPTTDPQSSANTQYQEGSRIQVGFTVQIWVDPVGANAWDNFNCIELWKSGSSSVYDRVINTIRPAYDLTGNTVSSNNQQLHALGFAPGGLDLYSTNGGSSWAIFNGNSTSKTINGAMNYTTTFFTTYPRGVQSTVVGPFQTPDSGNISSGVGSRLTTTGPIIWHQDAGANSVRYMTGPVSPVTTGYQNDFLSIEVSPATGGNGIPYNTTNMGYIFTGTNGDIFYSNSAFSINQNTTNPMRRENVPGLIKDLYASYSNPTNSSVANTYTAVIVGQTGTILRSDRTLGATDYSSSWSARTAPIGGNINQPVLTDFYAVAGDNTLKSFASNWVAVGEYGMIQVSNTDADSWFQVNLGSNVTCNFNGVRYGNGKWVVCGDGGNIYVASNAANVASWTQINTNNLVYTNGAPYGSIYGNSTNSRNLNTVNYSAEWNTWTIGGEGIILYSNDGASTFRVAYAQSASQTFDLTRVTYFGSGPNVADVSRPPENQRVLNNQVFSYSIVDSDYQPGQELSYYLVVGNMAGKQVYVGQAYLLVQEIKR